MIRRGAEKVVLIKNPPMFYNRFMLKSLFSAGKHAITVSLITPVDYMLSSSYLNNLGFKYKIKLPDHLSRGSIPLYVLYYLLMSIEYDSHIPKDFYLKSSVRCALSYYYQCILDFALKEGCVLEYNAPTTRHQTIWFHYLYMQHVMEWRSLIIELKGQPVTDVLREVYLTGLRMSSEYVPLLDYIELSTILRVFNVDQLCPDYIGCVATIKHVGGK